MITQHILGIILCLIELKVFDNAAAYITEALKPAASLIIQFHPAVGRIAVNGNASITTILSFVLGAAVAVAGAPDAGMAVIAGGGALAQSGLLKYSRTQEQAADQFAVNILDSTGQSARGLLEFLETLEDQQVLVSSRQDPYLQTHPLASDRINFVRNHIANSPYSDATLRLRVPARQAPPGQSS